MADYIREVEQLEQIHRDAAKRRRVTKWAKRLLVIVVLLPLILSFIYGTDSTSRAFLLENGRYTEIPNGRVPHLARRAPNGNIWLAWADADPKLSVYDGNTWTTYDRDTFRSVGLRRGFDVLDVLFEGDQTIVTTSFGVLRFQGGTWTFEDIAGKGRLASLIY